MSKKIEVSLWAERQFEPAPCIGTLRTWIRKGHIVPPPVKIGKFWYVAADARHIQEVEAQASKPRLIDRLRVA